jgi:uncharacterized protein YjbJ (UPF0337 family)
MYEDILKGQWRQLRGRVRRRWRKITDDDLAQIKGDHVVLTGKIQERHGRSREEAEHELDRWLELERML